MHIQHAHGKSNSWLEITLSRLFHFVSKAESVVSAPRISLHRRDALLSSLQERSLLVLCSLVCRVAHRFHLTWS